MTAAFYNENDPFPASWLSRLMSEGLIAPGHIHRAPVQHLAPALLLPYAQAHFFAGIGGWSHALRLAGVPDDFPIWTGSCPCQPFSQAGCGKAFDDERHLWPAWFNLIRECRPAIVVGEQVASPDGLAWLDLVRADLEGAGYAFGAADLCAAGVGAPHIRQRLYFVGHARGEGSRRHSRAVPRAQAQGERERVEPGRVAHEPEPSSATGFWTAHELVPCSDGKARPVEPGIFPLAHGVPQRVGRLRGYGNAIVPEVAATFLRAVLDSLP